MRGRKKLKLRTGFYTAFAVTFLVLLIAWLAIVGCLAWLAFRVVTSPLLDAAITRVLTLVANL